MDRRDIIVIGASAGGFAAVRALAERLESDFPAALFLVSHLPRGPSRLAEVLGEATKLSVRFAEDGDHIAPGTLLIAPPNRHLLLQRERVMLSNGPRENLWRPSIDVLFRSAAVSFRTRTIGIILSGVLDDGAAGLRAIHRCGGIGIVQDPADADFPEMPRTALRATPEASAMACSQMAAALESLVRQAAPAPPSLPEQILLEARLAAGDKEATREIEARGTGTNFTCPECGGPLNLQPDEVLRFRCRLGHAFAIGSLAASSGDAVEASLWAAIRLLEQRANIDLTCSKAESARGSTGTAEHHAAQAAEANSHADVLRQMLAKAPS